MNWGNLKLKKCPKCNSPLEHKEKEGIYMCVLFGVGGMFDCNFLIRESRIDELVGKIENNKLLRQFDRDNSYGINNLGRKR
jgi:hypothetical protein